MPPQKPTLSSSVQLTSDSDVSSKASDEALMQQVRATGDTQSFEVLYERYKTPILSYTFQRVRNRTVAEEIAQETFLRVYRARETYQLESKFTTWLWTIARNLTLDYFRKKKEVLLTPFPDEQESPIEKIESPLSGADQLLVEQAERNQVEECMSALTDAQREAITLRTVSELSYQQIAETMDTTLACVKSHLFRAKSALLDCIRQKNKGDTA